MNPLKKHHNFNYQCPEAFPKYHKLLSLFKAQIKMFSALRSELLRKIKLFTQAFLPAKYSLSF